MATRIYVVKESGLDDSAETRLTGTREYLVEAGTPSQAIRHKVGARFSAEAAKSSDVARLMASGVTLEKASAD